MIKFSADVRRDADKAKRYRYELMKGVSGRAVSFHGYDYLVIFADEQTANTKHFNPHTLQLQKKRALHWQAIELGYDVGDEEMSEQGIMEFLCKFTNREYYRQLYESVNWGELEYDFIIHDFERHKAIKVVLVGDTGYTKDDIYNLMFENPVSGGVWIGRAKGNTRIYNNLQFVKVDYFNVPDYMQNEYDWDKATVIQNIADAYKGEHKKDLITYLEQNLPDEL